MPAYGPEANSQLLAANLQKADIQLGIGIVAT
jgi:hypothetical protein